MAAGTFVVLYILYINLTIMLLRYEKSIVNVLNYLIIILLHNTNTNQAKFPVKIYILITFIIKSK